MIAKIFIKNLLVSAKVGEHIHERHIPQDILINVAVWADVAEAIAAEDISKTVNYSNIQKKILELIKTNEYVLIETLGNGVLDICFADTLIQKAWVRVEKPHKLAGSESVGIEIERVR